MLKFKDRLRNRRIENSHVIAERTIDDLKERKILQKERERGRKRNAFRERETVDLREREREREGEVIFTDRSGLCFIVVLPGGDIGFGH